MEWSEWKELFQMYAGLTFYAWSELPEKTRRRAELYFVKEMPPDRAARKVLQWLCVL